MIECNEIDEYISYVEKNPEKTSRYIKELIENIARPTIKRNDVFFDEETYRKCLRYCESNYYPLFPYQKFIYAFVFMYVDDEPLFTTIITLMGRGNGKNGFMLPLMNFFQTPMYGIKDYNIDIIANNEQQAKNGFNVVYNMLSDHPSIKAKFHCTKEQIENKTTHSILRFNTSNSKTKDGKQGGALLFDEFHAYENYDQINVFTSQLGKVRHARTFIISTQGYVREGPLDDYVDMCKVILKGENSELGYFPFICCLDDESEVDDETKWEKANPSIEYLPTLKRQIRKDYLEMKQLSSKRAEFMTKRMNYPSRDDEVTVATWENILASTYADIERKIPRETPNLENRNCIIGIDYADIRDFASAGLLFKVGDEYIWRQHTWVCSNSPFFKNIKFPFDNYGMEEYRDFEIVDEQSLSVNAICEWCIKKMAKYNVQKIVMDTYRFGLFRECFENLGIDTETRSNPFGLVRMIRNLNSVNALTAPLVEKAFTDRKINFGPSAIMRWYTNNTCVILDKMGNKSYGKIEPKLRKNDGFMAFVDAMSAENLLDELVITV